MKFILSLVCVLGLYQSASAGVLRSAYQSNLCLNVNLSDSSSWVFARNAEVQLCQAAVNQQVSVETFNLSSSDATFVIKVMGKCLDVDLGYADSWTHASNLQFFDCNGGVNQQFRMDNRGGGWFALRSVYDNRCVDIDLNTANGWRFERNVQLWSCNYESNQLWYFDPNGTGISWAP
jgi:hypothetical protein